MVKVKNNKTGKESEMTAKQWEEMQKNPLWTGVFSEVKGKVPSEVKKLADKKAETSKTSSARTSTASGTSTKPTATNADQSIATTEK